MKRYGRTGKSLAATSAILLFTTACASGSAGSNSSASGAGADCAAEKGPIKLGHLNYYTGPFSDVGPFFAGATTVTTDVINQDPPLGRKIEVLDEDIGTVGEAQVARKFLQQDKVDILLNPAQEYSSYRQYVLDYVAKNDEPLMPSVHAGSVDSKLGGTAKEPLFRGTPMDTAQAAAAVIQARNSGAKTVAIVASQIAGSQLQKDAAVKAAKQVGLKVVESIDVQPKQPTYRSTISTVAGANPDALLIFSQAEDGGTMVKQAAEAGLSLTIIGSSEWLAEAFAKAATTSAMNQHKAVWIAGFATDDSPAWDAWKSLWEGSKYADLAETSNSYGYQYFDLLTATALAIEDAGSTCASDWVKSMRKITSAPGKKVYTYQEGIAALRAGEDIDFSGVTGEYEYTDTGVVSGLYGVYEWSDDMKLTQVATLDGQEVLKVDSAPK